ncbi:MAG: tyrosine/phenylalanine carboxypeptidase domain-containing protein [Flavobacteriaceae bacterium]
MAKTTTLTTSSIHFIMETLVEESRVETELPGDGFLHLDEKLPFLLLYRKKELGTDRGTKRLAKSIGSYLIIGTQQFEFYQELIYKLTGYFSKKYNTYLLFEIYSGPETSNTFIIKGPAHKLPTTLDVLKGELEEIPPHLYNLPLKAEIKRTKSRQEEGTVPLIDIEEAKMQGAVWITMEVPPVYRDSNGIVFPVFFRQFRDLFVKAVQKTIFDYLRVQTSSDISNYFALGKRKIHDEVFKIDKQLTEIESSYQFLLLVSPVNMHEIRETYFESNFKELHDYQYRLLTIDPDLLKRKLFNLRIDEIDDPALSFIFKEKREELDQQITMLNERGNKNFFYNSIRLYYVVEQDLKKEALKLLHDLPEETVVPAEEQIDAKEFSAMARKEFEYFRTQDPEFKSKVHIREDVNVIMVSRGELYIPADYTMNRREAEALIQHEVGTHVLTYYNGSKQPLTQLCSGLAHYDPLQEGIAVLAEYFAGGLTVNRLRLLAGRVIAGAALLEGKDFHSIFKLLYDEHSFSKERAFNITCRILQGGGFLKDIIYLKGLLELTAFIKDEGDPASLLIGKFALKHLNVIKDLTEREILKPAALKPRYMESEDYEDKLRKIREGMPLSQFAAL